jgi:xanthine dehydrogenase accessory factor
MKIGDIDPRDDSTYIYTISDKSLAIGGAVLTAVLQWVNRSGDL